MRSHLLLQPASHFVGVQALFAAVPAPVPRAALGLHELSAALRLVARRLVVHFEHLQTLVPAELLASIGRRRRDQSVALPAGRPRLRFDLYRVRASLLEGRQTIYVPLVAPQTRKEALLFYWLCALLQLRFDPAPCVQGLHELVVTLFFVKDAISQRLGLIRKGHLFLSRLSNFRSTHRLLRLRLD